MTEIGITYCYFALRSIKKHLKNKNYGLMKDEMDQLGMVLEGEIKPVKSLEWDLS